MGYVNKEFAKAIIGVAKEKYPNINENDADNIDKVRLWWEQMENGEEVYKTINQSIKRRCRQIQTLERTRLPVFVHRKNDKTYRFI